MKRRDLGVGVFAALAVAAVGVLPGCSGGGGDRPAEEQGTLSLPLSTQGPSGATYRLRDATFDIRFQADYWGGVGGEGGSPPDLSVSSESDPDASSIRVSVERGYYNVTLRPGWRLEKVEDGATTDVEATLLSSSDQWIYVYAHSTTWVEYQFGLGDRSLWFNGTLNLQIQVYEKPSDIYGSSGEPSVGGAPGSEPVFGGASGTP
ncbi:MAG: hypothetical protein EOO73_02085 [Myxococcales bacterium]|nr:MAG: hypothetical protein EOO73_02085 [Myxococcales bacterium]